MREEAWSGTPARIVDQKTGSVKHVTIHRELPSLKERLHDILASRFQHELHFIEKPGTLLIAELAIAGNPPGFELKKENGFRRPSKKYRKTIIHTQRSGIKGLVWSLYKVEKENG